MFELIKNHKKLNLLVMADLHLCSNLDRIDLVHKAYQYADDNNIRYVINLGDLIDGVMPHNKNEIKLDTTEKQIDYVINNYPNKKNIKTLMLYGNHDYYSKYNDEIDVAKEISKYRKDIYNLGYGESYLRVYDNFIKLSHEISFMRDYRKPIGTNISFLGHCHSFKTRIQDNTIYVNVPSLSNLNPSTKYNLPAMLDVNFEFYNESISKIIIDLIDVENEQVISSIDSSIDINPKKLMKIKEKVNEYKDSI